MEDGSKDVDPEPINVNRKIEIEFSEEVTGDIALQTGAGDDVGWLGSVKGNIGTLELLRGRGQELRHETDYFIAGTVRDNAGNTLVFTISFVTR